MALMLQDVAGEALSDRSLLIPPNHHSLNKNVHVCAYMYIFIYIGQLLPHMSLSGKY